MLSKMILNSYRLLLEISMWLILIGSFFGGWFAHGFIGAIISLVGAFIFCVVTFGAFFVLLDIQSSVKAIKER
jgi:hypothetical protein